MSAFDIYGVFVPALLVMGIVAAAVTKLITVLFTRLGVYRLVWHRALFDLAVFVIALGLVFLVFTTLLGAPPSIARSL